MNPRSWRALTQGFNSLQYSRKAKPTKLRGQSFPELRVRKLKALGLCITCGKNETNGFLKCKDCKTKDKNRKSND